MVREVPIIYFLKTWIVRRQCHTFSLTDQRRIPSRKFFRRCIWCRPTAPAQPSRDRQGQPGAKFAVFPVPSRRGGNLRKNTDNPSAQFRLPGRSEWSFFGRNPLIFKGLAARKPSVYLSEKTEDAETDALVPRKRKNKAKMGKPSGAVPSLPHLPKKQRWAWI